MRGNLFTVKIAQCTLFISAAGAFGLAAFLSCIRDNPFDPKSNNYASGTAPEVSFQKDSVTGFIRDSISVTVAFSDTQAAGGTTPGVTMLYFNWSGDSAVSAMTDSVAVTGSGSITRSMYFTTPRNVNAYVLAKDNDGQKSKFGGLRLIVDEGRPRISTHPVAVPPDSVLTGDTVVITVSATDTNGVVEEYIWTVLGADTTTQDSILRCTFPMSAAGTRTVYVRVIDDDGAMSPRDSVKIKVIPRNDTAGPLIQFMSPLDNAMVTSSVITVMIQASDPSGVLLVYVNNNPAARISGTDISGMYQRVNVTLDTGLNEIVIWSMDNHTNHNSRWDTLTVTYQKSDNTPPSIAFSYPEPGDTVYQSPVSVAVTVTDQSGVAVVRSGAIIMSNPSGDIYTIDAVLVEGTNSLVITAQDRRGNIAVDTLTFLFVIRDKTSPEVQITAPLDSAQIAADSVQVTVSAQDTGGYASGIASVTLNGLPALLSSGVYSRKIALTHGSNPIVAVATDASPAANQAGDTVTVIRNTPPYFVPDIPVKDTSLTVAAAASIINLCAADPDSDPLSFAFVTNPKKSSAYSISGTGACAALFYRPDSAGLDTFKVKAADSIYGASDTLMVRIFIRLAVDTVPYFTNDVNEIPDTAVVGVPYTVQLTAIDPNGRPLRFRLGSPPTPSAAFVDSLSGLLAWTPGAAGTDSIAAFVKNTQGAGEDTLRWGVTVLPPDLPPVFSAPPDTAVDEMQLLRFTLVASDPNGDSLWFSFASAPPSGAALDSVTGIFSWTPTYKQAGTYVVAFMVRERNRVPLLSDTVIDTIIVNDINTAPVFSYPSDSAFFTTYESRTISFALNASDANHDSLVYSMLGAPSGAVILNGNVFTWTPNTVQGARVYSFRFVVADNGTPVMRDSVLVNISVLDSTKPVFVAPFAADTAYALSYYSHTVTAVDPDNDDILYSKLSGPDSLKIDEKFGIITWKPAVGDTTVASPITVSIKAADNAGNSDTLTYSLWVLSRWPRTYGNPAMNDTGFSVIQTADGSYAVCGTVGDSVFFMKADTSGTLTVRRTYGAASCRWSANCIRETKDGGFIMCGTQTSGVTTALLLIRTNDNGDTLWANVYPPATSPYTESTGSSVCLSADNMFVACGTAINRSGTGPATKMYVVKTADAAHAAPQWEQLYYTSIISTPSYSTGRGIHLTSDNGFIITGEIMPSVTNQGSALYLVKTSPVGDTTWTRRFLFSSGSRYRNIGVSVQQDVNNIGYYVCGTIVNTQASSSSMLICKINAPSDTGSWYITGSDAGGTGVRATADGGCIASMYWTSGSRGGEDAALVKMAWDGTVNWNKNYGTALNDRANDVAVTAPNGGYIFTGFATGGGSVTQSQIFLVKTDQAGIIIK